LHALFSVGRAAKHRYNAYLDASLAQSGFKLFGGDFFFHKELFGKLIIGACNGVNHISAGFFGGFQHVTGNITYNNLFAVLAAKSVGLHGH
jgi:hypothetical protein